MSYYQQIVSTISIKSIFSSIPSSQTLESRVKFGKMYENSGLKQMSREAMREEKRQKKKKRKRAHRCAGGGRKSAAGGGRAATRRAAPTTTGRWSSRGRGASARRPAAPRPADTGPAGEPTAAAAAPRRLPETQPRKGNIQWLTKTERKRRRKKTRTSRRTSKTDGRRFRLAAQLGDARSGHIQHQTLDSQRKIK